MGFNIVLRHYSTLKWQTVMIQYVLLMVFSILYNEKINILLASYRTIVINLSNDTGMECCFNLHQLLYRFSHCTSLSKHFFVYNNTYYVKTVSTVFTRNVIITPSKRTLYIKFITLYSHFDVRCKQLGEEGDERGR